MPRQLFDEAGNAVEVPDEAELSALNAAKGEVDNLKREIAALADKSPEGMKSLRAALARKEEQIAKLEGQVGQKPAQSLTPEEVTKTATQAAQKVMVDAELARRVADLSEEDKKAFKAKFEKLTAGEEVNMETVSVFADEAARAAGVSVGRTKSAPIHTGRGPRTEEGEKKFGETDDGKEFAKRMGLTIEKPEAKK